MVGSLCYDTATMCYNPTSTKLVFINFWKPSAEHIITTTGTVGIVMLNYGADKVAYTHLNTLYIQSIFGNDPPLVIEATHPIVAVHFWGDYILYVHQ